MSRIGIFSALYLPHVGGVENYTRHLAAALVALGHEPVVVTLHDGREVSRERDEAAGFAVLRIPAAGLLGGRYPVCGPRAFERALAGERFDHVVVNTRFYPHSILAARLARRRGMRPVVVEHGSAHLTLTGGVADRGVELVEHAMTALIRRCPARYYGVSRRASEWLGHFGIRAAGELHNSIDAARFRGQRSGRDFRRELRLGAEEPLVAFVGRLAHEKGALKLARAAAELPRVRFAFAGEGAQRPAIEQLALPNVSLLGPLAPADVAELLCEAQLMCLPSRSEGFATSLLEAAACGAVPLVTDVGGAEELLGEGEFGFLLESTEPQAIAAALEDALAHPDELSRKSAALRRRVGERFSWQRTAESLLAALQDGEA